MINEPKVDFDDDMFDDDPFDDEEMEGDTEEKAVAPPVNQRKAPPVDSSLEKTFNQEVGPPNTPSRGPAMHNITDDALVSELADLLLAGDASEMTAVMVPVFTGPKGPKVAKKLVREARDQVIAKIKRVSSVAEVYIDTYSDDD